MEEGSAYFRNLPVAGGPDLRIAQRPEGAPSGVAWAAFLLCAFEQILHSLAKIPAQVKLRRGHLKG